MARLIKERSRKRGLPPGSLVHIGEKKVEGVTVAVTSYDETKVEEFGVRAMEECFILKQSPAVTWMNVEGLQPEVIQKLGECYGFHPLTLEDILNTDQRPKIEDYRTYLYIVLKMLHKSGSRFVSEQVSLIIGENFVISFQEGARGDVFDHIRERIRTGKGRIRGMGADYLAYSLIDAIVDNYFAVIEEVGEGIENIETELIKNPQTGTLHKIHELKREIVYMRKTLWPLREIVSTLERRDSPLIKDTTTVYLRDVYDHTIQIIDALETSRDMLAGMLDIYMSSVGNKMNEIIKFLTIVGTIFIPLTFIVGIYGMNFEFMPELEWRYGYFSVMLAMLAAAVGMLFYFKRKKWI